MPQKVIVMSNSGATEVAIKKPGIHSNSPLLSLSHHPIAVAVTAITKVITNKYCKEIRDITILLSLGIEQPSKVATWNSRSR
jgi:hypothetical protein